MSKNSKPTGSIAPVCKGQQVLIEPDSTMSTPLNTLPQPYANAKKESYLYPLIGAFFLPIIVGFLMPKLYGSISFFFTLLVILIFVIMLTSIFSSCVLSGDTSANHFLWRIRPFPPGFVIGTDLETRTFPWAVSSLVIANALLFIISSKETLKNGAFPPHGDPLLIKLIISIFSSCFLHRDLFHLLGNMVFLWVFGRAIESRVGSLRFLFIYFLCIVSSQFMVIVLLKFQAVHLKSTIFLENFHSIGSSGAVAGILGLFVVRCFFARVIVCFPVLFIPFISMPIRIHGTVLVGLFFARDVAGSVALFEWPFIRINFWAHVGGYLCGFFLGYIMKLHKEALIESIEAKAERLGRNSLNKMEVKRLYEDILARETNNERALTHFFNFYNDNSYSDNYKDLAASYYARLMKTLIKKDFARAVGLFNNHSP
ncbi:rhomboid family intramembrane serine protease, partial [Thermodesulfobacteriota bacterium]